MPVGRPLYDNISSVLPGPTSPASFRGADYTGGKVVAIIWLAVLAEAFYRPTSFTWFRDLAGITTKQSITALVILAAAVATAAILWREGRLKGTVVRLPAVIFLPYVITIFLAVPAALNKGLALEGAGVVVAQILLLMGAFSLPLSESVIRTVLFVLVACGLVIAAVTIVLFAASAASPAIPCGSAMCMGPFDFRPIFVLGHWYPQATIPGIDKNEIGLQLSLMCLSALYFARTQAEPRWRWRWRWLLAAGLLFAGVVMTFSKGALASLAVGLVVLMIRRWYSPTQVILVAGFVAALLGVSGLLGALAIRLLTVFQFVPGVSALLIATSSRDTSNRFATVPSTLTFFSKNPITGIGPSNLDLYQVPLIGGGEHNFFLRSLAETGLVGELGLLLFLGLLVLVSGRALLRGPQSPLGDLLVAGLAVYISNFFVATVDYSFFVWTGLLLYWAVPKAQLALWPNVLRTGGLGRASKSGGPTASAQLSPD
jgi:O-antigen ligase